MTKRIQGQFQFGYILTFIWTAVVNLAISNWIHIDTFLFMI